MVGLIAFLFALPISNRRLKDDEDNLFIPFILLTFSIMFVMFSPVIATMTVSATNIFSATKQYSETYHIVGLQDGTYYKVEKEKLPQRHLQENGWHVTINQCDDTTNTYTAMEYDTKNVWYGVAKDRPSIELNYMEKNYNVPLWYKIAFFAGTPDSEKRIEKMTIYTPKEK